MSLTKDVQLKNLFMLIHDRPAGGATLTHPTNWNSPDLATYLARIPKFPVRSPTRAIPSATVLPDRTSFTGPKRAGIIAGSTVGGIFLSLLILVMIYCCCGCRTRHPSNPIDTSRVELPTSITPDVDTILGPDGKPTSELEQKTVSRAYPSQDSMQSNSPVNQHAELPTPPSAILIDPQTAMNGAIVQFIAHPAYRIPVSTAQSSTSSIPRASPIACYTQAPHSHTLGTIQLQKPEQRNSQNSDHQSEEQTHLSVPSNDSELAEDGRPADSPTIGYLYPQPLRVAKSPSREVSEEIPPGSAL